MYAYLAVHILLLFQNTNGHINTLYELDGMLEKCLFNVVFQITKPRDTIVIINNDSHPYLFKEVVRVDTDFSDRWSFMRISGTTEEIPNENLKAVFVSTFLIQIKTPKELQSILEKLQSYYIFNSRVNFLVTSSTRFENLTATLSSIFENLWQANIYNALIVLPHENDTLRTNLFTWFPFGKHHCAKDFSNFKRISVCYKGRLKKNKKLYPNKIPDRLRNCLVKVRTVVWPPFVMQPVKRINNTDRYVFQQGFEIALMNTIANSMNLNLTYTLSEKNINWGEVYDNGSATGMQAFLLQNEADIGISSQAYTQSKLKFFDMGAPYFFEHLVWCVPHSDPIPPSKKIIEVFSLGSWLLNIFVFSIFVLLIWRLSKLNSERSYKSFVNCLQNALGMLFGLPVFPFPRIYSLKLSLSFWFVFTMHLNIIYKTSLISMLANPVYDKQMSTVEEIIDSDLRLQFMPDMKRYFDDNQNLSKEILEKWIDCIDLNDCMDRVAFTRDSVILLPKLYLEFIENKYKRRRGSLAYCFNGNIVTYPGSMLMRKWFPLRNRINRLISRMNSGGLVEHWQKDALRANLMSNKTSASEPIGAKNVITWKEQEPAFICLLLGMGLATVTFVFELLLSKYKKNYLIIYSN